MGWWVSAVSEDANPTAQFCPKTDTQACLYHDEKGGNYFYSARRDFETYKDVRDIRGTIIFMVSEKDFHDSVNAERKVPFKRVEEFYFDRYGKLERFEHHAYSFGRTAYAGIHFGSINMLHWPRLPEDKYWEEVLPSVSKPVDTVMPYLTTSRDGVKWNVRWIYGQLPLQLGDGKEYNYIQVANQFVTWGGYHWMFYTGNLNSHASRWGGEESLWVAKFHQDRLMGLATVANKATLVTKSFLLED